MPFYFFFGLIDVPPFCPLPAFLDFSQLLWVWTILVLAKKFGSCLFDHFRAAVGSRLKSGARRKPICGFSWGARRKATFFGAGKRPHPSRNVGVLGTSFRMSQGMLK